MNQETNKTLQSVIKRASVSPLKPQPGRPAPPVERRWQFWRRSKVRDYSEQYRPPRWWQRLFSLGSLAVIALTAGVMAAVAIAAAAAAVAIALQSLIS